MNANPPTYLLNSELAQFCLPAAHRDRNQKLAWIDSVCFLFLVIGLIGLKPPVLAVKVVPPLEEPPVVEIAPVPPPPTAPEQEQDRPAEETEQDTTDAPAIVAVTLDSPAINFAVPTVGNLLVAASVAQAPPARPMKTVEAITNAIVRIDPTGGGGDRPQPDYPVWARQGSGMQGTVVLLFSVDASGNVTNVEIKKPSGYPRLDSHTVEYAKKRWIFPPADGPLRYEAPVVYRLR